MQIAKHNLDSINHTDMHNLKQEFNPTTCLFSFILHFVISRACSLSL
jgi:hypothetical protein